MSKHPFNKIAFVILLSVGANCFFSCSHHDQWMPAPLEVALIQAGDHRKELEKVLNRYKQNPNDSLKYRAACFLIGNMP